MKCPKCKKEMEFVESLLSNNYWICFNEKCLFYGIRRVIKSEHKDDK